MITPLTVSTLEFIQSTTKITSPTIELFAYKKVKTGSTLSSTSLEPSEETSQTPCLTATNSGNQSRPMRKKDMTPLMDGVTLWLPSFSTRWVMLSNFNKNLKTSNLTKKPKISRVSGWSTETCCTLYGTSRNLRLELDLRLMPTSPNTSPMSKFMTVPQKHMLQWQRSKDSALISTLKLFKPSRHSQR